MMGMLVVVVMMIMPIGHEWHGMYGPPLPAPCQTRK